MQLISIALIAFVLIIARIVARTWATPTILLCATWIIFLAVHRIIAPDFIYEIKVAFFVPLYIVVYFAGELTMSTVSAENDWGRVRRGRSTLLNRREIEVALWSLGFVSLIGSTAYFLYFAQFYGSIGALLSAGWQIRMDMGTGALDTPLYIRLPMLLAYSVACIAIVYWQFYGFRLMLLLPAISVLLISITQAARGGVLILLLMFVAAVVWKETLNRRKFRVRKFAGILLLIGAAMFTVFVGGLFYREQRADVENMGELVRSSSKTYALGAVSAFSVYLDGRTGDEPLSFGAYSFSSLVQLIGLRTFEFGTYTDYLPVSNTEPGLVNNNFTFFRAAIDDFGILGSLMYIALLGAFSAGVFAFARCGNLIALGLAVPTSTLIMFSVITPLTQHTSLLLCFVLTPVIIAICRRSPHMNSRDPRVPDIKEVHSKNSL